MPMDLHNVRLRFLAKYGNCNREDIPIIVLIFLEEYKNFDWDDIPIKISNYLRREVCNLSNVVVDDETDDDEEENEVHYYHHEVSHFVLQDSSMIEHTLIENSDLEDDDIDSNDYVPRSFKFVFDDSEDEDDYYEYDSPPQPTTQVVLQESNSLGHDPMKNSLESECSNSDSVESMEGKLKEEPIMPQIIKQVDVLENQVPQRLEILDSDYELYTLLGLHNGEFQEFVDNGDGVMTEAELLEMMEPKLENSLKENEEKDVMLLIKSSPKVYLTSFGTHVLSSKCEYDFVLTKEPKPPDPFLPDFRDLLVVKDVNVPNFDMDGDLKCKSELSKSLKFHTNLVNYSLLDYPREVEVSGSMLVVENSGKCTLKECIVIWMRNMPQGGHSMVRVVILEKYYSNRKEQENFLQVEYDWKGLKILVDDPP